MASRLRRPRPKPGGNENRSCEAPADQSAKGCNKYQENSHVSEILTSKRKQEIQTTGWARLLLVSLR